MGLSIAPLVCTVHHHSPSMLRSLLEKWDPHTNSFLFPQGERTITLLDIYKLSGLPLDGDLFEEYVPPRSELEPSLLMYPKSLTLLMDIWKSLEVGGEVSLQDWFNYFHNRTRGLPDSSDIESSRLYTAAFIALWLCCFVVVGLGPVLRPGVFGHGFLDGLGRRYSLAPPALCSLYYSLRLASTDLIGPSHAAMRPWPIHFLAGWMGIYLKKSYGDKKQHPHFPSYRHRSAERTLMENTMFRIPKFYTPEAAHDFLCKDANIAWRPYPLTRSQSASQSRKTPLHHISRVFSLAIRHGMLPWRRATPTTDMCIIEPYHPDRVTRQFGLDQVVPYTPLTSISTTIDIGVAYAFWTHLMQPLQLATCPLPADSYLGKSLLPWFNWWTNFIEPFASILSNLRHGNLNGPVTRQERERKYSQCHRPNLIHQLSPGDLVLVREIPSSRREEYVASIEEREATDLERWRRILHTYFIDNGAGPCIQPDLVCLSSHLSPPFLFVNRAPLNFYVYIWSFD